MREFADESPPYDISRIGNARQFHSFLAERDRHASDLPPYVPDVAACEFACAEARSRTDAKSSTEESQPDAPQPAIRRNPGVVLLRTAFDVRPVFEGDTKQTPAKRDTWLAIASISGEPHILELTPEVFDVLAALDRWVALDDLPGADELVADLTEAGLVELRR